MQILEPARKTLFVGSLLMLTLSFVLDHYFATDAGNLVPEPSALSLLAVGAVAGIVVSLLRRRKK